MSRERASKVLIWQQRPTKIYPKDRWNLSGSAKFNYSLYIADLLGTIEHDYLEIVEPENVRHSEGWSGRWRALVIFVN